MTALDWHPKTGLLLSSSADRGTIVWRDDKNKGQLMPQLSTMNELKGNTDACWNHRGDKFAVGAASGVVHIGSFNDTIGLWVVCMDTHLHDGPVVAVRFDPLSGRVVVSASADGTVILSSCYIPDLDKDSNGIFGGFSNPETTILFKFKMREWANTVSFSPSGEALMFASKSKPMTQLCL